MFFFLACASPEPESFSWELPDIKPNATLIDFGQVPPGQQLAKSITLQNVGDGVLSLGIPELLGGMVFLS
jgi:hypothetical protein